MNSKEIRRNVLEFLYKKNEEGNKQVNYESLKENIRTSDIKLRNAIDYLKNDEYIKSVEADNTGYIFGWIKNKGIDLIENKEEFGKLFSVNMASNNINISNIGKINNNSGIIGNNAVIQNTVNNAIPPEILAQLKIAIEKKDKPMLMEILNEFESGAKNVFWGIITNILM